MTRIFSAIKNNEDQILEQLDKDIDIAKEDGFCDADQYTITASDDEVILHDKINDEDTQIIECEDGTCSFAAVEESEIIETVPDDEVATLSDEELDKTVEFSSVKASKVKNFSLESLRSFAKGGWKNGKLYITIGDSDVALDLKNKVAIILDENLSCPIDPKKSIIDNLATIEKFMKENDLKVFSDKDEWVIEYYDKRFRIGNDYDRMIVKAKDNKEAREIFEKKDPNYVFVTCYKRYKDSNKKFSKFSPAVAKMFSKEDVKQFTGTFFRVIGTSEAKELYVKRWDNNDWEKLPISYDDQDIFKMYSEVPIGKSIHFKIITKSGDEYHHTYTARYGDQYHEDPSDRKARWAAQESIQAATRRSLEQLRKNGGKFPDVSPDLAKYFSENKSFSNKEYNITYKNGTNWYTINGTSLSYLKDYLSIKMALSEVPGELSSAYLANINKDGLNKYCKQVNEGKLTEDEFLKRINASELEIEPAKNYKDGKGMVHYKLGDKMVPKNKIGKYLEETKFSKFSPRVAKMFASSPAYYVMINPKAEDTLRSPSELSKLIVSCAPNKKTFYEGKGFSPIPFSSREDAEEYEKLYRERFVISHGLRENQLDAELDKYQPNSDGILIKSRK